MNDSDQLTKSTPMRSILAKSILTKSASHFPYDQPQLQQLLVVCSTVDRDIFAGKIFRLQIFRVV